MRIAQATFSFVLGSVLFLAVAAPATADTVFNPATSFEQGFITQSNPNGVWSYGYSSGFMAPITLYTQTVQPTFDGPTTQAWLSPSVNIGDSPSAVFNDGPGFDDGNVRLSANEFLLVSGIGGEFSDLVFTAPAAGKYSIDSSFIGSQHGIGTVVGVLENGSFLFQSSVTNVGQVVPFDTTLTLAAGQTLVFSVGPGGGLQNTGLSLTITTPPTTTTPEPSGLALLGTGVIALLGFRKLGDTRVKGGTLA
jgi:hypothetical protein